MLYVEYDRKRWFSIFLPVAIGWTLFSILPRLESVFGVALIILGQWRALAKRLDFSWLWVLFFAFCFVTGNDIGKLAGGSVQNFIDGVPGVASITYVGPERSAVGYVIAKAFVGMAMGCLIGLSQWVLLKPATDRAEKCIVVTCIGLGIAYVAYALIHVLLQRTFVGVYAMTALAYILVMFFGEGYDPSMPASYGPLVLATLSGLVEGAIAGVALATAYTRCLSATSESDLKQNSDAIWSFALGVWLVLSVVQALSLWMVLPPEWTYAYVLNNQAADHFIMILLGWWVFGPISLIKGRRALRSIGQSRNNNVEKGLAWMGSAVGSFFAVVMIVSLLIFVLVIIFRILCPVVFSLVVVLPVWGVAKLNRAIDATLGRVCIALLFAMMVGGATILSMINNALEAPSVSIALGVIALDAIALGAIALLLAFKVLLRSTWVYALFLTLIALTLVMAWATKCTTA